jgi:glycosyltransferase involved in cell wall biosynthesis
MKGTQKMKSREPMVSVVMPNYNTPEAYLRGAVQSVLTQTYQNLELIIVDDASAGNDTEVIRSIGDPRIRLLINEQNRHVAYTVNRGIEAARGEFIARMDSDDFSLPRRIERQVRFLQRHPHTGVVYTQARMTGDRRGRMAPNIKNANSIKAELFFGCPVIHPSVMFRASFLKENGLAYSADPQYKAAEDYELWSRCIAVGDIAEIRQTLLNYRVHGKQVTSLSGGLQSENAARVRQNMLSWLHIAPGAIEAAIHEDFCATRVNGRLKDTQDWARRLMQANAEVNVFDKRYFRQMVYRNYFVILVKTLLKRKTGLKQAFALPMTRQAMSPRYYPIYMKRLLFSLRLNWGRK